MILATQELLIKNSVKIMIRRWFGGVGLVIGLVWRPCWGILSSLTYTLTLFFMKLTAIPRF